MSKFWANLTPMYREALKFTAQMTACVSILVGIHGPFPAKGKDGALVAGAGISGASVNIGGLNAGSPTATPTTTPRTATLIGARPAVPLAGATQKPGTLQPVQNEFEDDDDDDDDEE